jgi:hypothetical protein
VQEQSHTKIRHQKRIDDLTRPRAEGGFGLPELAPQVVTERRALERAEAEFTRLQQLKEIRTGRWTIAAQLERSITDWLLRGGVPGGCVLEVVEDAPPLAELLKKGERVGDAIERYRHRLRELGADLHRVRSSPWPSSLLKQEAKAQIEQWVEAATPDFDSMVEHHSPLVLPTVSVSSLVHGETPALAFGEVIDPRLVCWLFMDQLVAKVNAGLDEVADDKHALDQQQREEMEAQISADMLAVERAEVACIWHAEKAQGEVIDFRSTTTPMAVLGLRLVNQPRANPSGTSLMHAIDIVGGWRR